MDAPANSRNSGVAFQNPCQVDRMLSYVRFLDGAHRDTPWLDRYEMYEGRGARIPLGRCGDDGGKRDEPDRIFARSLAFLSRLHVAWSSGG
jgi:hypothetical protein